MTGQGPPGGDRDPDEDALAGEESLNTGVPASTPPGPSLWGDNLEWSAPEASGPEPSAAAEERFAPPDPAAVAGPPWPRLVAGPGYRPPPMLRWPVVVALVAVVAVIILVAAFG